MDGGSITSVTMQETISTSSASVADVGGLVGKMHSGTITNVHTTTTSTTGMDDVMSGSHVGGLVGWQSAGTITDSSADLPISTNGLGYAGGLVGFQEGGQVDGSTAAGRIGAQGANAAGGLVGYQAASGVISGSMASGNVDALGANEAGGLGACPKISMSSQHDPKREGMSVPSPRAFPV
jgi:hypothetical protein